jgi:hypothetical protein
MSGADAAGPIADAAIGDLRALASALERDMLRIMLQLNTESGEDSLVRRQGQTAVAVYRQVEDRLRLAGDDVAQRAGARAVEAVAAVAGVPPASLPLSVREELDMIVNGQTADVAAVFRDAASVIREGIARGVASGGSLGDIVADVADLLDTTFRRAQAAVDAAVMAAGRRAVMAAAAEVGPEFDLVYVYVGPKDGKNRPFCAKWVGKAATEPAKLDNEQGLPVDDFCGGYNCRHSWAPTLVEEALREGYRIFDTSAGGDGVDVTETLRQQVEAEVV